ncbi:MarC family protein [Bacteriovorax sp. Seq25_V]|uniref:MarC family protein n=1 Tax=Bacteriovorax sp. Seq25_V TaxID=1201288 RepID=UPI00038A4DDD|nr:MarC family protein [Bacteriovorax sp. Seq25_V]EQC45727.1 MarC family integral membrane protein [Bacteriovorax sp. Seq25_V]
MEFNLKNIFSVTLILFSVIDIIGALPVVIDLRRKKGEIYPGKATIYSGLIMFAFLFVGSNILKLFGVDVLSFSAAGALIMFFLGLEMVLGIEIFKAHPDEAEINTPFVPLVFPLLAGAGVMTTLISLRAEYGKWDIGFGIVINLIIIYGVLKLSGVIQKFLGNSGASVLRKLFGIILLAIAIKLFKKSFGLV